jgi:hypothetical protein
MQFSITFHNPLDRVRILFFFIILYVRQHFTQRVDFVGPAFAMKQECLIVARIYRYQIQPNLSVNG